MYTCSIMVTSLTQTNYYCNNIWFTECCFLFYNIHYQKFMNICFNSIHHLFALLSVVVKKKRSIYNLTTNGSFYRMMLPPYYTYIYIYIYIDIYIYISALHKAGKQGGVPRYFSKRPAMCPALKIINY